MKVLITGSSGFVGRNLLEDLSKSFTVWGCHRSGNCSSNRQSLYFDLMKPDTWTNVVAFEPDVIINAAGYGVVKTETDINSIYNINYLAASEFFDFVKSRLASRFIQIGTAFEYDLEKQFLDEQSPCRPKTHYGISKFMMSRHVLNASKNDSVVLRPFGMFGPYENESKFFPNLILAQLRGKAVPLSNGNQVRDYFFVKDFSAFIATVISKNITSPELINVGSGIHRTLRALSEQLAQVIPSFDPSLWRWGELPVRANESSVFINKSTLAARIGFRPTALTTALSLTTKFYQHAHRTTEV